MSDFWGLSDGSSATDTDQDFELAGGGNLDPIPDGSIVIAMIETAKWAKDKYENKFLEIKWRVTKPEAFANRVHFGKLWIKDFNPQKIGDEAKKKNQDDHKRLFARIDTEAGGKLQRSGKDDFTDDDLAIALQTKIMAIKMMVYDIENKDGTRNIGNWIKAAMNKTKPVVITNAAPPKAQSAKVQTSQGFVDDLDSDVPF